jgi:hypothetical protein
MRQLLFVQLGAQYVCAAAALQCCAPCSTHNKRGDMRKMSVMQLSYMCCAGTPAAHTLQHMQASLRDVHKLQGETASQVACLHAAAVLLCWRPCSTHCNTHRVTYKHV